MTRKTWLCTTLIGVLVLWTAAASARDGMGVLADAALAKASSCSLHSASAMIRYFSHDLEKVAAASFDACFLDWSVYVDAKALQSGENTKEGRLRLGRLARKVYARQLVESDRLRGDHSLPVYLFTLGTKAGEEADDLLKGKND